MAGLTVAAPTEGLLEVELDNGPHNLMSIAMCAELTELLLRPPPGAQVLRLWANGPAFCLGRERAGISPGDLRAEKTALVGVQRAMRATPLVTVAEVQGDAAGFGVGLLAACDVAVAVADARLWFPEISFGLAPALVLAWLPKLVGVRQALWLTATGERITAARAVQLGLLTSVVAGADELTNEVDERVAALRRRDSRIRTGFREMSVACRSLDEEQARTPGIDRRLVVGSLNRVALTRTAEKL